MSVLGFQRGAGRELHQSLLHRGSVSRLWLEDRQATGQDQKKKKESYERCAWKDKAGTRGVRAGKQMSCSILCPRNVADGKLCSARAGGDTG